ncbi:MAG: phenylacetate--CoA ligase family protein [Deltaproteobacteria bacterium]|nr:phenylacetate--CoA ligase family protein [Deltaproteobacteria bacterium]
MPANLSDAIYQRLPVFGQNLLCTIAGYKRYRSRFSPRFHAALAELEESAMGPLERLYEIQRSRLDRLVTRARKHSPFYRDLPPPSDHRDPEEALRRTLASLPILEKSQYRDRPEAFLADDIPANRLRRGKTSGTTGTALPLWYTLDTLAEEFATVWRLRRANGVAGPEVPNLTFNGPIIVPFGCERPPFWRTNAYGHQTLFSLYHMTPDNLRAYVDAIHEIPAGYVQGYPSSIHLVARAMLEAGRPLPAGRMSGVFTSSESLLAFQRETIETAFAAPVRDRYGVSEFAVSMTGCELNQLHVDMEFGIVEVEATEETSESVTGPLLVTGLAHDATPLIRYRIGDVGTRSKRPCPCGRPGDVFLDVDGRVEDYVQTPDGRLIGRLDHIFKEQLDIAEAQIIQETKEAIEVLIVPRSGFSDVSERQLVKEIRSRLGDEIGVSIRPVKSIPREPNGKFRAVKSRVGSPSR